ncbi:hypothetical protein [Burkholderia gladioli]|uniref:hypothetical protein n=1 Tax=Burkholderia gladioli TaxID=28095 RepID=UPI00163E8683|nr:hypothetical protein [Burkholderia gladioli]
MATTVTTMKMALASEEDLGAAYELLGLLDSIDRGYYPAGDEEDDAPMFLDEDDPEHLRRIYARLKEILGLRGSGAMHRVIGGFSTLRYEKNQFLDLTKDTVELHPRIIKALELEAAMRDKSAPPAIAALPPFPVSLRKMWSGGDVQRWIDDNIKPLVQERHFDTHCAPEATVTSPWAAVPAPARDQFSYALREDAERWTGPFDSVEDAIEDALSNVLDDERATTVVWIATNAPLDIDCDSLADDVIERIQEQAYDEVGEVADTIGPFEAAETKLLSNAIKQWIDEYGEISCYKIENPKAYGPGAPEHNAALTRGVGDTR